MWSAGRRSETWRITHSHLMVTHCASPQHERRDRSRRQPCHKTRQQSLDSLRSRPIYRWTRRFRAQWLHLPVSVITENTEMEIPLGLLVWKRVLLSLRTVCIHLGKKRNRTQVCKKDAFAVDPFIPPRSHFYQNALRAAGFCLKGGPVRILCDSDCNRYHTMFWGLLFTGWRERMSKRKKGCL